MSKKVLTVVIPTYNRNILFKKSLLNFLKFKDYIDIFLVEDGSTKEVIEKNKNFLENYKNVKYFVLKKNYGQSYACNFALKLCTTKYVWFFDDDDDVSVNSIKAILSGIKNNAKDAYLLPMSKVYDGFVIKIIYPSVRPHSFQDLRNNGQLVNTSCAIFRTSIIKKINGWDNDLYGGTDTDLFLRFSKHGNFSFLKTFPIKVNIAVSNRLTNKVFRQQKAKFYFLLKHWNVLTIKRKFYYIFSLLFFLPLFYALKDRLILLLAKIKNNIK
jgi:glycosyltransferase involved in cell wall biosynthesis